MAMRIASLVPSATEALFALGLGDDVVAVTHECDWPAQARELPRLTRSVVPAGLAPAEIDQQVRERTGRGESLYALDEGRLRALEPDLIVTQELCAVCAVSFDDVCSLAGTLPSAPQVLSLDPHTLADVLEDLVRVATAARRPGAGERLRDASRDRLERVSRAVGGLRRPRVLALEWLDPPYAGGHWVPEMVATAGGQDVLGEPGARSRTVSWTEAREARPEVVVVMPFGLYADEAAEQAAAADAHLSSLRAARVLCVDAASSFSRPGPRLVEGTELLAHLLHPDAVGPPADLAWREPAPA